MVDVRTLLPELRSLVHDLSEDLLERTTTDPQTDDRLHGEFLKIKDGGRTAQSYEEWREDYLDQVAVAWVLACIFVRFLEDNDLIDECWLAGEGDRRKHAEGAHELYFRQHPHETDREYLKHVFIEIRKLPAATELFAEGKTPLWAVDPSGDAARRLLEYFREIDPEKGGLKRSFGTPRTSTQPLVDVYQNLAPQARFLGDLYQDLSEHAQKKYALKQTPEFIEQFILDRTLDRAIDEFGLKNLRLIDPTCGSGHFLLGAFDRLFHEWMKPEYGVNNETVAAQNALDSLFGVDINSFAIAITRFRLLVAAVQACRINKLHQQTYAWKLNLATGDTLLWGSKPSFDNQRVPITHQGSLFEVDPILAVEDPAALREILGQGYHVVVGNPPYITVKDRAQNDEYRRLYSTCYRLYSLGVPFTQRFWELAIRQGEPVRENVEQVCPAAGYIGMITANSFMKREFGKKLIEEFFPKTDLTHLIDTSELARHLENHGTPTVILFGRSRKPVLNTIRAVLGIKGDPSIIADPSQSKVWQSIVRQIDRVDAQDEYTSTADVPRATFASHPWSIGGGGVADVKDLIEANSEVVFGDLSDSIGFMCITKQDDVFCQPKQVLLKAGCEALCLRPFGIGEEIRDWSQIEGDWVIYPYNAKVQTLDEEELPAILKFMWPQRTVLEDRKVFGGQTYREVGKPWYEYGQIPGDRQATPLSIAFAFVATHNHFVLDRGGKVFNRSAPIIKLPADGTEDDHLALLGLLNSSTACFWMKQVFHNKGAQGVGGGVKAEAWEKFYEHTGTGLERYPVPEVKPLSLAQTLDQLGQDHAATLPEAIVRDAVPTQARLGEARAKAAHLRGRMIALQEELDWECYRLYGLLDEDLHYHGDDFPELKLGERAFEIVMARTMAKGDWQTTWFERHGSTPVVEIPAHWPDAYRRLVERRIDIIATNKEIGLVERPEYKRRWNDESWEAHHQRALRNWLLDRLESPAYWPQASRTDSNLQSTAKLADKASADHDFLQVAALYRGRPDFDVSALVAELVEAESVPFLPVLRYKLSGLRKREVWERTWDLQRRQDAGADVGEIPVPPKYVTGDFSKSDYWRLRGKLDVPKERWISYPHLQTESDPSLVVGSAGWDHLQQAQALVAYYDARKREGWDARRLTPILAGLDQLLPWIHQWHPEIDPEFGDTASQSYQALLENDAHELGLTLDDIRNWQPPQATTRRRART